MISDLCGRIFVLARDLNTIITTKNTVNTTTGKPPIRTRLTLVSLSCQYRYVQPQNFDTCDLGVFDFNQLKMGFLAFNSIPPPPSLAQGNNLIHI